MTSILLLAILLLAGAASADANAQAPEKPAAADAQTGSIRGRITAADTGRPVRRARIRVTLDGQDGFRRPIIANTNSRGEFEITGLREGSYFVTGTRAGFVDTEYGQRRPLERGHAVRVRAAARAERIDIALPRAGVLSGRATDELGEPYPGVRVEALALRYRQGKREPAIAGLSTTDDLGNFRISGLQPGRYYVVATSSETWRNEKKQTIGFASTYYPGGPLSQAELVAVGPSEQKSDLFLTLQSGPTARISGRVVKAGGDIVPGAGVTIAYSYPGVVLSGGMRTVRASADGSFQIKDVPGGVYSVSSGGAEVILTVDGADVDGIVLTHRTGSTVSGTLVTDEGTPPPFPVSGVRVFIDTSSDDVLPTVRVAQVANDWSFKMQNLGGPFLFRLTGLPDDWMMASASLNDANIADVPFDVPTGGKEIPGVKIVVSRKVGRITGSVLDENGRPTSAAAVLIFADDSAHWIPHSRFIRSTRPGADGQFSVTQLPAGVYRAVALDYIEDGQHEDAAFLAELRDTATTFTLGDGGHDTLTLTVRSR